MFVHKVSRTSQINCYMSKGNDSPAIQIKNSLQFLSTEANTELTLHSKLFVYRVLRTECAEFGIWNVYWTGRWTDIQIRRRLAVRAGFQCGGNNSEPIYCQYIKHDRPPLWSSGQSFWLLTQRSGFDSQRYQIFWVAVGLERGPLSPCESKWGVTWKKSSGSGLEDWD
jgi:hypothetical protein